MYLPMLQFPVLFISVFISIFPSGIIFLLPKELALTFHLVGIGWWWLFSAFVFNFSFSKDIFAGYRVRSRLFFFFQYLRDVTLFPKRNLLSFLSLYLWHVSGCSQHFLLTLVLSNWIVMCFLFCWGSLNFLDLCLYNLHLIW